MGHPPTQGELEDIFRPDDTPEASQEAASSGCTNKGMKIDRLRIAWHRAMADLLERRWQYDPIAMTEAYLRARVDGLEREIAMIERMGL